MIHPLTQTPLEDGSYVNQHTVLKPITVSVEGQIADVFLSNTPTLDDGIREGDYTPVPNTDNLTPSNANQTPYQKLLADALGRSSKLPDEPSIAVEDDNSSNFSVYSNIRPNPTVRNNLSNTGSFYDYITALVDARQTITLQTAFKDYEDMMVSSFSSTTDNENNALEFNIEFTQINYIQNVVTLGGKYASRVTSGVTSIETH